MSSRLPHMGYILNPDLLQRSSFRGHCNTDRLGLGMSKAEIKAKHPPGTSPKHINAMHKYMTQDGLSFQQAHNKAEASGFPALGNTGLGHCNCAVPSCPSCNNRMGRTIGITNNQVNRITSRIDFLHTTTLAKTFLLFLALSEMQRIRRRL